MLTLLPVPSVLLQVVAPLVSCKITVPDAAVFVELVIVATNADNVLVIDNDNITAAATAATININFGDNRPGEGRAVENRDMRSLSQQNGTETTGDSDQSGQAAFSDAAGIT